MSKTSFSNRFIYIDFTTLVIPPIRLIYIQCYSYSSHNYDWVLFNECWYNYTCWNYYENYNTYSQSVNDTSHFWIGNQHSFTDGNLDPSFRFLRLPTRVKLFYKRKWKTSELTVVTCSPNCNAHQVCDAFKLKCIQLVGSEGYPSTGSKCKRIPSATIRVPSNKSYSESFVIEVTANSSNSSLITFWDVTDCLPTAFSVYLDEKNLSPEQVLKRTEMLHSSNEL